ncbi:MAG: hypothetical protein U1F56_10070 [Rubrivivax sp.]
MEQSTLIKIARLRTMAARHGKAFDVVRFAGDRQFAQATLQSVLDTDDENLMVLGLELMDALKMVTLSQSPPAPAAPARPVAEVAPTPSTAAKYIGRLR